MSIICSDAGKNPYTFSLLGVGVLGPVITNATPTNIATDSAYMNGFLTSTGTSATYVWVFWGESDGMGTNVNWTYTNSFGQRDTGVLTTNIASLSPSTTYYYRYFASNAAGTNWGSPSSNFTTLWNASINNYNGATNITETNAFLYGDLTLGSDADVYIYWGETDGGTAKTGWDDHFDLGALSTGVFSNEITGRSADTVYYYRCAASNNTGSGEVWAPNSSVWLAKTMNRASWLLMSIPIDYGNTSNNLNSTLGVDLKQGLVGGTSEGQADNVFHQSGSDWIRFYLNTSSGAWQTNATIVNRAILPGEAFWIKRFTNGPAIDYSTFAGAAVTNSATITCLKSNWVAFGWPYGDAGTTNGSGTTNIGWGFAAAGATTGYGSDTADRMFIEYNDRWYDLYLDVSSNWFKRGTRTPTDAKLVPGGGYYYYHRGAGDMPWTAPRY